MLRQVDGGDRTKTQVSWFPIPVFPQIYGGGNGWVYPQLKKAQSQICGAEEL